MTMYFIDEVMQEERGRRGRAAAVMRFRVQGEAVPRCLMTVLKFGMRWGYRMSAGVGVLMRDEDSDAGPELFEGFE